jgi:hypothetical protein
MRFAMKKPSMIPLGALSLLLLILLAGCSGEKKDAGAEAARKANASRVLVVPDGSVFFDGEPVTLDALPGKLAEVKNRGGGVWYHREKGDGTPNPSARIVLNHLVNAQIPVQLFADPEFSKPVSMGAGTPAPAL